MASSGSCDLEHLGVILLPTTLLWFNSHQSGSGYVFMSPRPGFDGPDRRFTLGCQVRALQSALERRRCLVMRHKKCRSEPSPRVRPQRPDALRAPTKQAPRKGVGKG